MPRRKLVDDLTFGPARRRRRMHRRLRELDRALALETRGLTELRGNPGKTRDRLRTVVVAVGTAGLVSGWVWVHYGKPPGGPPDVASGVGTSRAIIMHELGHLVGLSHVDDPGELMHEDNLGLIKFGSGDREGLAALGSGRCFPGR